VLLVCLALAACAGCFRRQSGTPPQPPSAADANQPKDQTKDKDQATTQTKDQAKNPAKDKKTEEPLPGDIPDITKAIGKLHYGWDGQSSSMLLKEPLDAAFARSIKSLKELGFTVKTCDDTWLHGGGAQVCGLRPDKTSALILLYEKSPGVTEVLVRITSVGDRTGSERVLGEIEKTPAKPEPLAQKQESVAAQKQEAAPSPPPPESETPLDKRIVPPSADKSVPPD
jgi:hypothetical protein